MIYCFNQSDHSFLPQMWIVPGTFVVELDQYVNSSLSVVAMQ